MSDDRAAAAMRASRPTMRDVAALAGVAIKTVSRVMNGEPTVAPDLASRVQVAAQKLGYRPNLTASSLRRGDGRTATIGLLLEDVANPFSSAVLRVVEDYARERGVQVLIGSVDEDAEREREIARMLIDRRADGLIIVPAGHDQSYLYAERALGTRVVFLDREPRFFEGDAVVSDNRQGAVDAITHLAEHGHQRIAYLGDSRSIATAQLRYDGYTMALARCGLPGDPHLTCHGLRSVESAMEATREILAVSDPPTALFASQNLVTIGALRVLRELGLQHSVALVGFDDLPLADLLDPGVSVVTQDVAELARLAAERLFHRIESDELPARTWVVPTRLVPRGSGEIRRSEPRR
jgi:LacI family transcriptional regulator